MISINPKIDFAFKKIFGSEDSKDILQQLPSKRATKRVAGRSPAMGFIFLVVAGLKENCCS
jgi:hypothetical protein